MTTQPADEDTLIQAARAERSQHRSGASMVAMLGVAVALGVAGCLLIFVPHLVTMLLPGPLRLLGGLLGDCLHHPGHCCPRDRRVLPAGGACVESAGLVGEQAAGGLPELWPASVALDTVPGGTSGTVRDAPRGIVTLCETPGCNYAAARVTRASGATSPE